MFPLENPRQKFVAIHLGHQEQKVKCPVAQVRVLGFFETPEDLKRHYPNPDLDVYTIPVGAWFAVTKAPTPPEKAEELQATVVERVNAYIQNLKAEESNLVKLSTEESAKERYDKSKASLAKMQGVDELVEQTSPWRATSRPSSGTTRSAARPTPSSPSLRSRTRMTSL